MHKVLIRPLKKADAEVSWRWRNDSEIWEYTGSRPDISVTAEVEKIWISTALNEQNSKRFAIEVDDKYVGNIQLTQIDGIKAQYHIFIGDKNYWGKGIAFIATQQIIRYAKNVLELKEIYLYVNPLHYNAIKLYEKCGFVSKSNEIKMELFLEKIVPPKLSIFCMVYNHEEYLKDCIESFLMQKCFFDFEIVIGEDCSTDNSRKILLDFLEKYPGKFNLLLHDKNIGAVKNQRATYSRCNGEYIAMCEGDDFWLSPYKIHTQVNFLEFNSDYSLIMHNAYLIDRGNKKSGLLVNKKNVTLDVEIDDLLYKWAFPTSSLMFRRKYISELPYWFDDIYSGDFALVLAFKFHGKIKFFRDVMSVYRVNNIGDSATARFKNNNFFILNQHKKILTYFNEYSNKIFADSIQKKIIQLEKDILFLELKTKGLFQLITRMPLYLIRKVILKIYTNII